MKEFSQFVQLIGGAMPDLVSLILCPALLLVAGLLLAVFHKEKAYLPVAVGLGGAAAFLAGCEAGAGGELFVYLGLYVVLAVLVKLLFLIPFPRRANGAERAEEMYRKFHAELEVPAEDSAAEDAAESGESGEDAVRLGHALSLLEKLKRCNLSASDRLEADALGNTLENCKGRPLGEEEVRRINDCLATILKLTAKYKL